VDKYFSLRGSDGFHACGELVECHKCHRKIVVEMGINGTPHHFGTSVTCLDCLVVREEFRTAHPEITNLIDEWKQDTGSLPVSNQINLT